jgi:hypothetical protein
MPAGTGLMHYIDSQHMDKVEKIIDEEIVWDNLLSNDWKFSFELSLKGMLNRLLMTYDDQVLNKWREFFASISSLFSVNKFVFIPHLSMGNATFPHHIMLEFDTPSGRIKAHDFGEYLLTTIVSIIESKLLMVEDDDTKYAKTISEFRNRVTSLANYILLWSGDKMTFEEYRVRRREFYHDEIKQFDIVIEDFKTM